MVPKNIPHKADYMTCKSLEQAQRDSTSRKGRSQERRGHMKGFSEEFIAPMWNPVKEWKWNSCLEILRDQSPQLI